MDYKTLREKVQNHPKYPGCVNVERAPLIHSGFPGTFNLSFTEYDWLREYGRYIDFDHNFIFSTVQSCIRPDDLPLLSTEDSWKYLGVFEIGDLTGAISLSKRPDYEKLQRWQISSLIHFLKNIGISPNKIHPSYCAGGTVKELTENKYTFDFFIPEDKISRAAFLENDVPEKNLIPDKTRDTFLSLHLHRPSPWGYRTEINANIGSCGSEELLDIATTEYIPWRPIYQGEERRGKNIISLEESKSCFAISAVGLERLCMAINGLPSVRDVDYIAEVYDAYGDIDESEGELVIESLRALHRIYSDVKKYECKISRHHNGRIKDMLRTLPLDKLDDKRLEVFFQLHAQAQPWHPELKEGIEPTLKRIEIYRAPRNRVKSRP